MNIDKLKRISSALLLTSIIGTSSISLTGCSDSSVPTVVETEERKDYAIYVNNDIAMIYIITGVKRNSGNRIYYSELNEEQKVTLQGELVHFLKNYTLEEAEMYAKDLINENGLIRYYNVNDREISKKLKKTK